MRSRPTSKIIFASCVGYCDRAYYGVLCDLMKDVIPQGTMYVPNALFLHVDHLFFSGRGSFRAILAAGHAGGPLVHKAQVWAPAGPCGVRSGRSRSRELASNHGIAFRRVRASQENENPTFQLFLFFLFSRCIMSISHRPSSPQALFCGNSSRASLRSFVCDGHGGRICVCVCVSRFQ